eukprot:c12343_g1_i4.p1 GENE.c12343_g1_i4~~c12343_g1_i4.p1  ORF type:complete len:135 (-),score=22.85 c12343_g1_i4:76-447(-)
MGKRKSSTPAPKKKIPKLESVFDCPMCCNPKSIEIKMFVHFRFNLFHSPPHHNPVVVFTAREEQKNQQNSNAETVQSTGQLRSTHSPSQLTSTRNLLTLAMTPTTCSIVLFVKAQICMLELKL